MWVYMHIEQIHATYECNGSFLLYNLRFVAGRYHPTGRYRYQTPVQYRYHLKVSYQGFKSIDNIQEYRISKTRKHQNYRKY